jgi:adenosylcobinamide hydrolase
MKEYFISKNFVRHFDRELTSLSTAPFRGGLSKARGFFFMYVDKNYSGDYLADCKNFAEENGLEEFVGFMTAANIPKILSHARRGEVEVYTTAGLENLDKSEANRIGTINICLIVSNLNLGGMVNALMTATEAKSRIVYEKYRATGTTSDGIGIFCAEGKEKWAGTSTQIGMDIRTVVRKALKDSIEKWEALRL